MKILAKDLARALLEVSDKNPKNIPKIVRDFYFYLLKKRKIKMLPFILEKLREIAYERAKIKEIALETAFPATSDQKQKIKKVFGKQKVMIKENVNPKILGGIILKINGTIYDGSLKGQLEKLKEALWQTAIKS